MMEQQLLQFMGIFIGGLVAGVVIMLALNKFSSGSASPKGLKQEYNDYQAKVETHFEETSKKFQDMTEQYQDLYKHLSVGATSLCRPDSVAAGLADQSIGAVKLAKQATANEEVKVASVDAPEQVEVAADPVELAEQTPESVDVDQEKVVIQEDPTHASELASTENTDHSDQKPVS